MEISEIIDQVLRQELFYHHGEGGLTVSGGEPLSHGDWLIRLLKEAKKHRLHTAIESCGYASYEVLKEVINYLDVIFFDIKSMNDEKHKRYTTEALLNGFEDYLRTPVVERIRLKKAIERTELRAVDALLSGVSALSYMSDLAHEDSAPTIALEKYQLEALKEHMGDRWLEAQWYEPAAIEIEVWSYPVDEPSDVSFDTTGLQCVDPFSLYVACAKSNYKDDRLLDAVEQLRRAICQK